MQRRVVAAEAPVVERVPLLGVGEPPVSGSSAPAMLSAPPSQQQQQHHSQSSLAGETQQRGSSLSAQLSRLEEAHRGGMSADAALPALPPGVAGGASAPPPPPPLPLQLPPRVPGSLYAAALAATGEAVAEEGGVPVQRRAFTTRMLSPCARSVNGNVTTFYRCRRESRAFPQACLWGPDWPCNLCTWALILGPSLPFQVLVAWRIHLAVSLVGLALAIFALWMLAGTALSDPGYLPKQSRAAMEAQRLRMEEQGLAGTFTVCQFCNVIREQPRTSHCYDCNACVLELDHHCPWMGQCVGKYNLRYFYGFLWAITALLIFTAASFFTWCARGRSRMARAAAATVRAAPCNLRPPPRHILLLRAGSLTSPKAPKAARRLPYLSYSLSSCVLALKLAPRRCCSEVAWRAACRRAVRRRRQRQRRSSEAAGSVGGA
jgi:hypothetical protein